MCTKKSLITPSKSDAVPSEVTSIGPIVVVRANGNGKTRLGWWIEKRDTANVHRVSVQKSFALPEEVHARSLEKVAERW
jgi:hypothetical protein